MSSDAVAEGARCEELEKITIDNDDDKYFKWEFSYLLRRRKSWLPSLEKMLMRLLGVLMKLPGCIQVLFFII